jgi:transglutaminase-like putative cysteine protease
MRSGDMQQPIFAHLKYETLLSAEQMLDAVQDLVEYLDGRWFTFDARHNHPRIGRVVMARGRDAADVAISTSFGNVQLARFTVITEEACEAAPLLRETAKAA